MDADEWQRILQECCEVERSVLFPEPVERVKAGESQTEAEVASKMVPDEKSDALKQMAEQLQWIRFHRNINLSSAYTLATSGQASVRYLGASLDRYDTLVDELNFLTNSIDANLELADLRLSHERLEQGLLADIKEIEHAYRRWRTVTLWASVFFTALSFAGLLGWLWSLDQGEVNVVWGAASMLSLTLGLIGTTVCTSIALEHSNDGGSTQSGGVASRAAAHLPKLLPFVAPVFLLIATVWAVTRDVPADGWDPRILYASLASTAVLLSVVFYFVFSRMPRRSLMANTPAEWQDGILRFRSGSGRSIRGELSRIEGVAAARSSEQLRSARRWRIGHYVLGGGAALAAGGAGARNIPSLAILAAALTALATALNPGRQSEEKQVMADGCSSLAREIGVMGRVDLGEYTPPLDREALEDVVDRYDSLIGAPERRSFWARNRLADSGMASSHALKGHVSGDDPSNGDDPSSNAD
jgi:hypothetical protein